MIKVDLENHTFVEIAGREVEIIGEDEDHIIAECDLEDLLAETATDFPQGLQLQVHTEDGFGTYFFHELLLFRYPDGVALDFRCHTPNKYWDGRFGLATFLEAVQDQVPYFDNLEVVEIELEDDWKGITLRHIIAQGYSLHTNILMVAADLKQLLQVAEIALSGLQWRQEFLTKEDLFCKELLYPLLRRMGFLFVRYTHGRKEYGKDFTFSESTPFGLYRHYGLQAKAGDVRGGVNAAIDELLGQINDAFAMPYYELGSKEAQYISTFIIAISGSFTENARDKIAEKMPKGVLGSVYFLDRERLMGLVDRYWLSRVT